MGHDVGDGDRSLVGRRELRPVVGDGRVDVQLSPVGQDLDAQRRERLRDRHPQWRCSGRPARPEIDHFLSVVVGGVREATFTGVGQVLGEDVAHSFEAGGDLPFHR
jgi:hypothetical protein